MLAWGVQGARALRVALALACSEAWAEGTVALPLPGPVDGRVAGFLARVDGLPATPEAVARARAACLVDRKAVTDAQVRRVASLARKDRDAAFRKLNAYLAPCMEREGWLTRFCGGPGETPCPVSLAPEGGG